MRIHHIFLHQAVDLAVSRQFGINVGQTVEVADNILKCIHVNQLGSGFLRTEHQRYDVGNIRAGPSRHMTSHCQILCAVSCGVFQERINRIKVVHVAVCGNTDMGEGRDTFHVVVLTGFFGGEGGEGRDKVNRIGFSVADKTDQVGVDAGSNLLSKIGGLRLNVVRTVCCQREPDMIDVFSLNLTGERFLDNRIIEAGSAVLMVHGVLP